MLSRFWSVLKLFRHFLHINERESEPFLVFSDDILVVVSVAVNHEESIGFHIVRSATDSHTRY
jgi:hypothetical protein